MKKLLALLIVVVFLAPDASAWIGITGPGAKASHAEPPTPPGEDDYSDIIFYSTADSVTTGQSPLIGSGTITIGGSYTSVAGQVGNAWSNNNSGNTGGRITFSSSNLNVSEGRAGFWLYTRESGSASDGEIFYTQTANPKLRFSSISGTYEVSYKDISIFDPGEPTLNAWTYVEIAWDSDGDKLGAHLKLFYDGVEIGAQSGSTGADPTATSVKIGSADGNAHSSYVDQVIISNDPARDLYALRNQTSF